ncbi:MAG: hemerythrin domain-containing protein [Pseudomonadota bacterium]
MDATELLTEDHRKVRKLLDELNETTERAEKTRRSLLEKIALELKVHNQIEEEIFYPAFKNASDESEDEKMYFEALEEHRAAGEFVLPDLLETPVESEKFGGRAKVLKELVEHHANEEEKEMFGRARELFSEEDLSALGRQLAARKKELLKQLTA